MHEIIGQTISYSPTAVAQDLDTYIQPDIIQIITTRIWGCIGGGEDEKSSFAASDDAVVLDLAMWMHNA